MTDESEPPKPDTSHRILDEAGDTTFLGEGRIPIIGQQGVSLPFAIGMVSLVVDLYDSASHEGNHHYHTRKHRLTASQTLSPPSP